jgi:NAD(P)H-flavin reductase
MLLIPGVGEVAISIAGGADEGAGIAHTIRFVGLVTRVIEQLQPGDRIGLRGPYGTGWPLPLARGQDVLIVAGGLGLPPLRPALRALLQNREQYGRLMLLYGARSPADLMYPREYAEWERRGVELLVTVDHADESWSGRVGVVPALLKHLALAPERTIAFTCGPEIMMRFAARDLLARGLPASRLFLSIERNMQCGIGLCGRCQIGPYFVCKDGPVMSYDRIGRFVTQEHF